MLRNLPNAELARLYDSELVLKLYNAKNLRDTSNTLSRFMSYLGAYPPSPELAKSFLAQYTGRKVRTLYRYTQMIRGFMKWYGEPIDDIKVRVPKSLPAYTEGSDIEKLLAVISNPSSTSSRSHDTWTEALRVALDPANLCQALEPEKVEEMQLFRLPTIDRNAADQLRRLSSNNARRQKR